MLPRPMGPANWLMKPMALTMTPEAARPLARMVVSSASLGMTPCRGISEGEDDVEEEVRSRGAPGVRVNDIIALGLESSGETRVRGETQCAHWKEATFSICGLLHDLVSAASLPNVPMTRTLRRGILSVRATAEMAPMAESTELSRLYPSWDETELDAKVVKDDGVEVTEALFHSSSATCSISRLPYARRTYRCRRIGRRWRS